MGSKPTESGGGSAFSARSLGLQVARRAQIRLEGRLPWLSTARRELAPREAKDHASHLPILLGLQRQQALSAVLELGAGDFSTGTFLDRACFPTLDRLTSVEVNPEWRAKIESSLGHEPRLEVLGAGHATTRAAIAGIDVEAYDLVFVDDSDRAADRAASIAAVIARRPRRPLVVIHDFEVPDYRRATAAVDHVFIFAGFNPMTGVCWNGSAKPAKSLKAVARIIDEQLGRLEPDDRQGWVAVFEGGRA